MTAGAEEKEGYDEQALILTEETDAGYEAGPEMETEPETEAGLEMGIEPETAEVVPEDNDSDDPYQTDLAEDLIEDTCGVIDDFEEDAWIEEAMDAFDDDAPRSGECGRLAYWEITGEEGALTLTISGQEDMYHYETASSVPWIAYVSDIVKIDIGDSITGIGRNAFSGMVSLEEIYIPKTVTSIGEGALEGSTGNLVIYGEFPSNGDDPSRAETYAKENNIRFLPMNSADLSDAVITLTPEKYTYTGSECRPAVEVVKSVTTLKKDDDYEVVWSDNVKVGTARVTVTGKGKYTGTAEKTFTISPASIAGALVSGLSEKTYTGSAIKQAPSAVTLGGKKLVSGTDYTVSWKNNVNPGTASVIITGKGNYNGSLTKSFRINKAVITKANVEKIPSKPYTGKKIKPNPVIKIAGRTLQKGTDYKLKYKNNKKIGKATVTITGTGNYTGKVKVKFKIRKASIADMKIKGIKDKVYTGKKITQSVKIKSGKKKLTAGKDFTVTYKNNVNCGTASAVIKGKGNYKGTVTKTFKITQASIKDAKITGVKDMPYTGKAVTLTLKIKVGSRKLKAGTDYQVTYKNNVNLGTASVTIKGKGNYKDSVTKTFKIKIMPISQATVTDIKNVEYTGRSITQDPTVKINGTTLKAGKDYTISYSNNFNVGTATMTIKGIGSYNGSLTKEFYILPVGVTLKSITLDQKRLSIKWNPRENEVEGYRLQYSTDKQFRTVAKDIQIRDPKKDNYLFLVSDPNTVYYVRICSYKTANDKKYYSNWRVSASRN